MEGKKAESDVLSALRDEELLEKWRDGQTDALDTLLIRYKNVVKYKAQSYYMAGADKEDLLQEGMIGLYKAVCDFQFDGGASFRTFAELCIERQLASAIKMAARKKHGPLNDYISLLHKSGDVDSEQTLLDVLDDKSQDDPADLLAERESNQMLRKALEEELSPLEKKVFNLYLQGNNYQDIARVLDKSAKSIDNALQRIKQKARFVTMGFAKDH